MTSRQTYNSIPDQFSDFIKSEYPRFVEFLKAYYKFLDQETSVGRLSKLKDVDATEERFVANYRREFALDIPKFDFLESRRFILFSRALYEAKGTEDALKFLYRAAFGKESTITYPRDNILRSSAGNWHQEHFIDVDVISGSYSNLERVTYESESGSPFSVEPTRFIWLSEPTRIRFYFETKPLFLFAGMRLVQRDEDGVVTFLGSLRYTPSSVSIVEPGVGWKVGQLVKIPGTGSDTFIRIIGVNSSGGVTKTEVIEFGYEHNKTQLFYASPYPVDPALTTFSDPDFSLTKTGTGPYTHTIEMGDYLFNVAEDVSVSTNGNQEVDYSVDFEVKRRASPVAIGVSIPTWVNSRAKFRLESGLVGSNKGRWLSDDGHLSNSGLNLQDNFFYQAYSYLVSSEVNSSISTDIIKINHPAGLKFFKQIELSASIEFDNTISRSKQRSSLYLYDTIDSLNDEIKELVFQRALDETLGAFGELLQTSAGSIIVDSFELLDASTVTPTITYYVSAGYWDPQYSTSEILLTIA